MAPLRLVYRPLAEADFATIYEFIAADSPRNAIEFVTDIRRRCQLLLDAPELGPARPDLGPNLRIHTVRRRVVVVYRIADEAIEIVRIFYAGQDYEAIMRTGHHQPEPGRES